LSLDHALTCIIFPSDSILSAVYVLLQNNNTCLFLSSSIFVAVVTVNLPALTRTMVVRTRSSMRTRAKEAPCKQLETSLALSRRSCRNARVKKCRSHSVLRKFGGRRNRRWCILDHDNMALPAERIQLPHMNQRCSVFILSKPYDRTIPLVRSVASFLLISFAIYLPAQCKMHNTTMLLIVEADLSFFRFQTKIGKNRQ